MGDRFIIVERDLSLKDCGVFTGQIEIVDSRRFLPAASDSDEHRPLQTIDGVSSPEIEHAFLFNFAWDAWRFALQFRPHWDAGRQRFWGFRRWVARKDMDYWPGEAHVGAEAHNPSTGGRYWIPHEALIAATDEGFQNGRKSAFAELGREVA